MLGQTPNAYYCQNKASINFINLFFPSQNNLDSERDLSGFSMFFGNNFDNNPLYKNLSFREDYYTLNSINDYLHLPHEADNYFTPNLFKGFTSKHRKIKRSDSSSLMWLTSLYLDIDGVEGVYDPLQAKTILYNSFEKAGFERPNIINHSSTNPFVRLQLFWLLDPMYLKEKNDTLIVDRVSWWKDTARAMIYKLKEVEPRLKIDIQASTNVKGYMRIPGSYNQKTGERVKTIFQRVPTKRYTLEDGWLNNLRQEFYKTLKDEVKIISGNRKYTDGISLLEHPQFKMMIDNGVPEGYRHKAVYALTKACFADGLSYADTVQVLQEFNEKCTPSVAYGELIYWIKSSYGLIGSEKGWLRDLDPAVVAEIVNKSFNTSFKPDPRIKTALKRQLFRNKQKIGEIRGRYISKKETIDRTVAVIAGHILTGDNNLPNQKKLAMIAGVKYNSLAKYWPEIKKSLYQIFGAVVRTSGRFNDLTIVLTDIFLYKLNIRYCITNFLLCKIPYNKKSIVQLFSSEIMGRAGP